jgi:inositol transport system substrate-binding protein
LSKESLLSELYGWIKPTENKYGGINMKKAIALITILTLLFALVSCAGPQQTSVATNASTTAAASQTEAHKLKIGLSWYSMSAQFPASIKDAMMAKLKDMGLADQVEMIFLDAQNDALKQNSQVDNLISQKVDAIVIIPFDREQNVPAIQAAKKANIPIIELNASTTAIEDRTSYVGSDDLVSGKMLMECLAKAADGKGKMVILHGPTGQNAEVMRHTGAKEILKNYPGIEIVAEKVCDWDRAKALDAMNNILQSGLDFNIVFSENDEMAMGASVALQSAKRKDVVIGGIDAIPDALQAVKDGVLTCTVFQNAKAQGETALEVALKAAKGEPIEKLYDIPYELVTKENVDQYMK